MIQSEVLKEHDDEVYHVLFSPSGKYFTTTGKDGYVVVSISVKDGYVVVSISVLII
jgi:WD40 repeat protein